MNSDNLLPTMNREEMRIFHRELILSGVPFTLLEGHDDDKLIVFSADAEDPGCQFFYIRRKKAIPYLQFFPNTWILRKCEGGLRNPESMLSCSRLGEADTCCFAGLAERLCNQHGIP